MDLGAGGAGAVDAASLLEAVFQATSEFIWAVDVERFGLLAFNRGLSEYFRVERGIVIARGDRPEEIFPPGEYVERWKDMYGRALRDGPYVTDYAAFNGSRTLQFRFWPVQRDGAPPVAIVVFGVDVTAQRRAQEELARSEARFRALVEEAPVPFGVNRAGAIVYINRAYRELFGVAEGADLRGESLLTHIAPPSRERMVAQLRQRAAGLPAAVEYDVEGLRSDGSAFPMHVVTRSIDFPDGPATLGVILDLSERHRAEEQLRQAQKLESLGRLAGGVAHDFNNLLTVILSCSEALCRAAARGAPTPPEDAEQISRAANRARELTAQLLAFARPQGATPEPIDPGEALAGARKMLERLLGEDVALELAVGPGLWLVLLDRTQLDQILLNLAANARDALPRGGRLRIAASNLELAEGHGAPGLPAGGYVRLEFEDDGVGMPPEVREKAFDPFFTTKAEGLGTGLGLATVHGIIAQAGGRVAIESAPGRGTRFEILLPRTERRPAPPAPEPEETALRGSETILLVEDDAAVRRQALRALAGAGYGVHLAGDGREALALADGLATPPQLLVTDVIMPGLDGGRLAQALRARWPGLRVLFMSGYADDRLRAAGIAEGEGDLLQKPFTGGALLRRVRAALDRPAGAGPVVPG